MKNQHKTLMLTLIIALVSVVPAGWLNLATANPYHFEQVDFSVSPPSDVQPPTITILSPTNYTQTFAQNLSLDFGVFVSAPAFPELFYYYLVLEDVYYTTSWLPNSVHLNSTDIYRIPTRTITYSNESRLKWGTDRVLSPYTLSPKISINLTNIPSGEHWIEVYAVEKGSCGYSRSGDTISYGTYTLNNSSILRFSIDKISILSPENTTTYNTVEIPLIFKHNFNTSYPNYSFKLDNNKSQTINGNTTLPKLFNGEHNVTVYATNNEGETGASEVIYFNVNAPEPLGIMPVASIVAVSLIVAVTIGVLSIKKVKH